MTTPEKPRSKPLPKALDTFRSASLAGFLVGVGGVALLRCENAVVGALLFCVGLATICTFRLGLFTGRVGYALSDKDPLSLFVLWVGNLLGAYLCGQLIVLAAPDIAGAARAAAASRTAQSVPQTLALSFFCGVLMFIAVDMYRRLSPKGIAGYLGIFLCVPAFILSGHEHSVADMFYFAAAGCLWRELPHILLVSSGNALGAIAIWAWSGRGARG